MFSEAFFAVASMTCWCGEVMSKISNVEVNWTANLSASKICIYAKFKDMKIHR